MSRLGLALPAFLAFVALGALAGCPDPEVVTEQRTAVEHGRDLAADPKVGGANGVNELTCLDCHAESTETAAGLSGGSLAGATTRPSYWAGQELTLLTSINDCRYYFMLSDGPWSGEEEEARAIYAWLESLPGSGAAVPFTLGQVADPGPGDAAKGKDVYARACASCHGATKTGAGAKLSRAPVLPDETLADHPLGDYTEAERRLVFVEKVRHGTFGGYGGQMPPLSVEVLSDEDLADCLAYMGVP
jgi:thiosulfate dehydrogenase